jgi:hypothetical protein
MLLLLTVIGLSAISGMVIYGLFWKQFKKVRVENQHSKWRKYHRQTGLALALFTVLFAFSGGYHAAKKWNPIAFEKMVYEPVIKVSEFDDEELSNLMKQDSLKNVSLVKCKETVYYRSQCSNGKNDTIIYANANRNALSAITDTEYAKYLANYFKVKVNNARSACCEMVCAINI